MGKRATSSILLRLVSSFHTFLYRLTAGHFGRRLQGAPVLLLTVTGRKSGLRRTKPLLYLQEGDDFVVVASNGGQDWDPHWWTNLKANPSAEVQVGKRIVSVRAERANEEERTRLWPLVTHMYSGYARYQKRTRREIPLVKLHPVDQS